MTRALRRLVAKLGIAVLLFMQFADASYVCPVVQASSGPTAAMADSGEAIPMGDCAMIDRSVPNLCAQHCQKGSQASGNASPPLMFPVELPLLAVVALEPSPARVASGDSVGLLTHVTAPPVSIRFGVFRS